MVAARRLQTSQYQFVYFDSLEARSAVAYAAAGANACPMPYTEKNPGKAYKWGRLQHTFIPWNDTSIIHPRDTAQAFPEQCNIGIITGRVSGNLFVIDFDTREGYRAGIAALQAKGYIDLFCVESHRGGHIYLRSKTDAVENYHVKDQYDLLGNSKIVAAFPSVKRLEDGSVYHYRLFDGLRYRDRVEDMPQIPVVDIAEIDFLQDENGNPYELRTVYHANLARKQAKRGQRRQRQHADQAKLDELISRAPYVTEGERNNTAYELASTMKRVGYADSDIHSTVLHLMAQTGLDTNEIQKTVSSALRGHTPNIKTHHTAMWEYGERCAVAYPWEKYGTRPAERNKAVFLAFVARCRLSSIEVGKFRASYRELAELAEIGRGSVERAIRDLVADQLIERVSNAPVESGKRVYRAKATQWRFGRAVFEKWDTNAVGMKSVGNLVSHFSKDDEPTREDTLAVLRNRGTLGHKTVSVYQCLVKYPDIAPKELAAKVGLKASSIYYHLHKLEAHNLARKTASGWIASNDPDKLHAVAVDTGAFDKRKERKAKHQRQRLQIVQYIAGRMVKWNERRNGTQSTQNADTAAPAPTPDVLPIEAETTPENANTAAYEYIDDESIPPEYRQQFRTYITQGGA